MIFDQPPEHMSRWVRSERLYRQLLAMGLVAIPMFADDDRTRIDHLLVTVELPFASERLSESLVLVEGGQTTEETAPTSDSGATEHPAEDSVLAPVESAEVEQVIHAAEGDGNNVIEFPPEL